MRADPEEYDIASTNDIRTNWRKMKDQLRNKYSKLYLENFKWAKIDRDLL